MQMMEELKKYSKVKYEIIYYSKTQKNNLEFYVTIERV